MAGQSYPPYITLERVGKAEITERRSVFIGSASPAKTEEEALAFIAAAKAEHQKASHCVYAYLLFGGNITRYSDAGEPQGTAGLPVLDVIRKGGFGDAVITVTRYFGGVLLGAAGLVRAYTAAASAAAADARIVTYERFAEFKIKCGYSDYSKIDAELNKAGVRRDNADFGEEITLCLAVKEPVFPSLSERLKEITAGRVRAARTGFRYDTDKPVDKKE